MSKDLNWAVLGTGVIANEMAAGLQKMGKSLYAVGNRTHSKAVAFAEKYSIKKVYASIDEMFSDDEVDIIYITSPHNTHYGFMKKALENGKHLLVEKSITLNSQELDEMAALAESKGLILAEAMTIWHMPLYKELWRIVGSGELGKVQMITVNFGSYKEYNMENRFFNRNLAGGAMLDIGVYALSIVRSFMDEAPAKISSQWKAAPTGVDGQATILLQNGTGQMATVALTIVAMLYKFVLVLIGVFIAIFFNSTLNRYLEGYMYLFYFGLSLNFIVVVVLIFLMINPNAFRRIARKCERGLVKTHILKPSVDRVRRITKLAKEYNMAVTAFMKNIKTIVITAFVTVLQRCSIFFITYFIYRGMGLNKESVVLITVLQASVYVAVDLLPLPGSQGISELMYQTTFGLIFIGAYLPASVLITRGISFYLPLIVGFAVTIIFHFVKGRKKIQDKVFEK